MLSREWESDDERRARRSRDQPAGRARAARAPRAQSPLGLESRDGSTLGSARARGVAADAQSGARHPQYAAQPPRGTRARCRVPRTHARARTQSHRIPRPPELVPAARTRAAAVGRLFQHGVRHHRRAAPVLGRPRRARRRSPQDRERPRHSAHRGRPLLPRGLFPPDARYRGLAARNLCDECARVPAGAARDRRRRDAAQGHARVTGTRTQGAHLARIRGPRRALPARQRRPAQLALRPWNHRETLRRRQRDALHAGGGARHRWLARARGARRRGRRTAPQRGPRRVCDDRAHALLRREARHGFLHRPVVHAPRQRVHDAHAGGRGLRPLRRGTAHEVQRAVHARSAPLWPRARPAPRARSRRPAGYERTLQHGVPRGAHLRAHQRRERAARPREPAHLRADLSALARARGAGRTRHERRARAVLGLALGGPPVDRGLRQGTLARQPAAALGGRGEALRRADLEFQGDGAARPRRLRAAAPAQAAPAARRERGDGGGRARRARSERAHARVRTPLHRVQAADDAARAARAARAIALQRVAPDATHHRRQGPPARRTRPRVRAPVGRVRATPGSPDPGGVPRGLRHGARRAARPGRRRVDQHAAPPVGGERHQRNEGARERRTQPLGTRRLVGRGMVTRSGLGAWRRTGTPGARLGRDRGRAPV